MSTTDGTEGSGLPGRALALLEDNFRPSLQISLPNARRAGSRHCDNMGDSPAEYIFVPEDKPEQVDRPLGAWGVNPSRIGMVHRYERFRLTKLESLLEPIVAIARGGLGGRLVP
jgi:hypothetical protein